MFAHTKPIMAVDVVTVDLNRGNESVVCKKVNKPRSIVSYGVYRTR